MLPNVILTLLMFLIKFFTLCPSLHDPLPFNVNSLKLTQASFCVMKRVYAWLLGLLGQNWEALISNPA